MASKFTKRQAIEWADEKRKTEKSDGCTLAPDFDFTECCERHDMMTRFNQGITDREADRYLRQCIKSHGHPIKSWIYWAFARYSSIVGNWKFAAALIFFVALAITSIYIN